MSAATQAFGELGERIAERWLARRGWRVVHRRYRFGHRDIDLVVERDGVVAFVEVKARSSERFGDPIEAVNWRKRIDLERSALSWISRHGRIRRRGYFGGGTSGAGPACGECVQHWGGPLIPRRAFVVCSG